MSPKQMTILYFLTGLTVLYLCWQFARQGAPVGHSTWTRNLWDVPVLPRPVKLRRTSKTPETVLLTESSGISSNGHRMTSLNKCILNHQDGEQFYKQFSSIVNDCVKQHTNIKTNDLFSVQVGRYNEKKVFRKYSGSNQSCSFLTIGIGGDIEAELEMKRTHPHCTFTGIDPKWDQGKIFEKVGKFIPYGLALEAGRNEMLVRLPDGTYKDESVPTIEATQLVQKYLKTGIVHFGTIDIEGYEYKLLQQMSTSWTNAGFIICQLDIELHSFGNDETLYDWLKRLFLQNDVIAIHAADHVGHRKLTIFNQDRNCKKLFDVSLLD